MKESTFLTEMASRGRMLRQGLLDECTFDGDCISPLQCCDLDTGHPEYNEMQDDHTVCNYAVYCSETSDSDDGSVWVALLVLLILGGVFYGLYRYTQKKNNEANPFATQ